MEKVLTVCRKANIPTHLPASAAARWAEELRAAGVWMQTSDTDAISLLQGMQADVAALPKAATVTAEHDDRRVDVAGAWGSLARVHLAV
jgi:hypothetical protein